VAIVDDMLSGLDRTTEEFVWNNVFGPHGIFRQHGITVILATHSGMFTFVLLAPVTRMVLHHDILRSERIFIYVLCTELTFWSSSFARSRQYCCPG